MLRDPRTNTVPRGIRSRELGLARGLPRGADARAFRNGASRVTGAQALTWTERGPNNVGGRTRAFAIDVTSPTTLLAGSVGGGLWKSTDDGASWTIRSAPGQIHGITCIAQDRRAGKTGTWYAGTGEIRGSTTNDTRWGSLYRGDGIFKSIDGGETWDMLPFMSWGTPETTEDFDFVINVATNPANAAQDEVFAAAYAGVYRSANGGTTWSRGLPSDSGFTDVAVTSTGITYACTRTGTLPSIWRTSNGTSWAVIQPASFPTTANRIVIGLAPSNPAVVYFFVQGSNTSPHVNNHQLWKYTYLSGDGSGAGGMWENRGGNLPSIDTQGGYDQVINVRPNDENFVILGGTNLFRSTNGFASNAATTVIGGYSFYPAGNHHPDLHAGAFSGPSYGTYYSAGDGGIAIAPDITLANMLWTSLNHGYNVTQFYSVSIPPDAGSDMIMAGAQDNGSQLGNAPGASNWIQAFGGDGTIVEVSPAADDRLYTQYQNGQMQRQTWSGAGLADMTPAGSANWLFVNPIVLDPNNSSILYYAGGVSAGSSRIWRNDSAPVATTTVGWSSLPATDVGVGAGWVRKISALGISQLDAPDVLYYGTTDGIVMKATDANTATPVVTNITPPGLNAGTAVGGFVRCIAVDPNHADRALLAFGNYNFQSLWYTADGGASWTDVEGNLAGSSGPSIRWASMFYVGGQLQVFLATSVGVLSTTAFAGGSTVWTQEAGTEIGNVICGYMDYRASDRTLAVATHGRGVFTTQFHPTVGIGDGDAGRGERPMLGPSYPNPSNQSATIAYVLPRSARVTLRLYDVTGRIVTTLVDGPRERGRHDVRLSTARLASGSYYCELRVEGAVETRRIIVAR